MVVCRAKVPPEVTLEVLQLRAKVGHQPRAQVLADAALTSTLAVSMKPNITHENIKERVAADTEVAKSDMLETATESIRLGVRGESGRLQKNADGAAVEGS